MKEPFMYYEDRWNFPIANDMGFEIIEDELDIELDDNTKNKILYIYDYLIKNNISYEKFDDIFDKLYHEYEEEVY
ncbi:MAG: hypothetical protein ACOC3V_05370 [bacterium]